MSGKAPFPVRELAQAARSASDAQLLRLVAVLDQLPQRGVADAVLDPVRPRLRALRPVRPMTAQRLLFLPLDGLIVAPREWRGEGRSLPRHAVAPLADSVLASPAGLSQRIEEAMAGASLGDHALAARIGAVLWPAAAEALPVTAPGGWVEAGLPAQAYARLRPLLSLLWRHGPGIHALRVAGGEGPPEELARPFFRALAAEGGEAVEIGLAAVLPAALRPASLIAMVAGMDRALAAPAERALDHFLAALTAPEAGADLARTAASARRFAALVEDLEQTATRDKPRRARILQGLRSTAAQSCSAKLEAETRTSLIEPIGTLLAAPAEQAGLSDAAVERMEAQARALRALADTGRRLDPQTSGSAEGLREATARLASALPGLALTGQGFGQADALRLIEILAGSDAAAACDSGR